MLSSAILCVTAAAALPAASAANGDFRGAVEVDGRKIHLECKGEGRPAVILISGYRNDADTGRSILEEDERRSSTGSRASPASAPMTARARSSTQAI